MPTAEYCPFCDPAELLGRTINDTGLVKSAMSNPRFKPHLVNVHALVVPTDHIVPSEDLSDEALPDETLLAASQEIRRLTGVMLGRFAVVVSMQKSMPAVPQGHNGTKVDHIHWHVLGGDSESQLMDGVLWVPDSFEKVPQPQFQEEIAPTLEWLAPAA